MQFQKLPVNSRAVRIAADVERVANRVVRGYDGLKSRLRIGGRKGNYDDENYEFMGGAKDKLRKKHYDKSLRLLWKAQVNSPWLDFRDATNEENQLRDMALRSLSDEEREARDRMSMPEFKAMLDREYTPRQKQAIVSILSAIGHGEAYAWLVSASLLNEVQSTGARSALTMQVLEEAKHFIVLRELLHAFDVPVPRLSAWEYLLLEGIYKSKGVNKFFGMNVLVETIALSLFGLMSTLPGLEILRLFHLDEARHTALPGNYLREFPLTKWQRKSPVARLNRLKLILPALALIPTLEEDLAELGIDAFAFGGSVIRKIATLAGRSGFDLPVDNDKLFVHINNLFNAYCTRTRPGHEWTDFMSAETTVGERELATEREILFGTDEVQKTTKLENVA